MKKKQLTIEINDYSDLDKEQLEEKTYGTVYETNANTR